MDGYMDGWVDVFVDEKRNSGEHRRQSIPEQPTCFQSWQMEKKLGTGTPKSLTYVTVLCLILTQGLDLAQNLVPTLIILLSFPIFLSVADDSSSLSSSAS